MEIILLALVAGGLYLYHESTGGSAPGAGGGGGINIAINAGGSLPKSPQTPKPGGGGSGGGFGMGGGGGGGAGGFGLANRSSANDPIANFLDDRQSESYANQDLKAQADAESTTLTPYEQQQLDQMNQQDYWNSGNEGPAPLADAGGGTTDSFIDDYEAPVDWGDSE